MAYIKARPNGGFLITVSCGRDAQDHKISKSVTFRPDPCTAKGHLKSENTIQREVKEYAAAFEKKVLLGQCIEGDSLTLENTQRGIYRTTQLLRRLHGPWRIPEPV